MKKLPRVLLVSSIAVASTLFSFEAISAVPNLTAAPWVISGTDVEGLVWNGSTITFKTQTPSGNDYAVTGQFNWTASGHQYFGRENFAGTLFSDNRLNVAGFELVPPTGGIYLAKYTALLTNDGQHLINGTWDGSAPSYSWFASQAVLPIVGPGGAFNFDFAVQQGAPVYIDPTIAIGYDYKIGSGDPLFRSVRLPSVGDGVFELDLFNGTDYSFETFLNAGDEFIFNGAGVDRFRVRGIEASAGLDPASNTAFITGLTFAGDGRFTGTQTPLTLEVSAVPEPETYMLMLAGLVLILSGSRRRVFGSGIPTYYLTIRSTGLISITL